MARERINATITYVSYIDKAANQKLFFFIKPADQSAPAFQMVLGTILLFFI